MELLNVQKYSRDQLVNLASWAKKCERWEGKSWKKDPNLSFRDAPICPSFLDETNRKTNRTIDWEWERLVDRFVQVCNWPTTCSMACPQCHPEAVQRQRWLVACGVGQGVQEEVRRRAGKYLQGMYWIAWNLDYGTEEHDWEGLPYQDESWLLEILVWVLAKRWLKTES